MVVMILPASNEVLVISHTCLSQLHCVCVLQESKHFRFFNFEHHKRH